MFKFIELFADTSHYKNKKGILFPNDIFCGKIYWFSLNIDDRGKQ